jgi:hypothetical protein
MVSLREIIGLMIVLDIIIFNKPSIMNKIADNKPTKIMSDMRSFLMKSSRE